MRLFIKIENDQPITWPLIGDNVKYLAPEGVSFPSMAESYEDVDLVEFGFETFIEVDKPTFNPLTQIVEDSTPIKVDGQWTRQWVVTELTTEQSTALLQSARSTAWEAIKSKREQLSDNGGYQVNGKWFHSDSKSKTQQLGLVIMGANVPPVQWKTMDGSFVTMTQQLAGQIFQAAAAQDMAIFTAAETHNALMQASANPADYDFSNGWPETYQG